MFFISSTAFASEQTSKWAVGMAMENMAGNGGLSFRLATPAIINGGSIHAAASLMNRSALIGNQYQNLDFQSYDLGYEHGSFFIPQIKGYGKGSLGIIVPNTEFSDRLILNTRISVGLELLPTDSRLSYFIEVGSNQAINGRAEKETHQPFFANGLYGSIGIKAYLL